MSSVIERNKGQFSFPLLLSIKAQAMVLMGQGEKPIAINKGRSEVAIKRAVEWAKMEIRQIKEAIK
jgi:hypothetical protein